VVGLYYYAEATMKEIGAEIGVNESRVSQLHARAIQRLKKALGGRDAAQELVSPVIEFQKTMRRLRMAKADGEPGVLLKYPTPAPARAERPVPMRVQRRAVAAGAR
jgi:RNA polymerase sigma factor for flagellar operon FliA